METTLKVPNFEKLVDVIEELRHPEHGCPWDLKQSHESLLKYLIEESYEYLDAVHKKSFPDMEEELGDVLLQVLLHSQLAKEAGKFDIESVSLKLREKLIRRHPHVFEKRDTKIDVSEVLSNWEKIKAEEKAKDDAKKTHHRITNNYLNMPSLSSAMKIGKKTNEIKFDWDDYNQVAYKVEEEWQELKEELAPATLNKERVKEELGDLLFSMAQLARHLDVDPEDALREANSKFIRRFNQMENLMIEKGAVLENMNQTEMDHYWNEAKQNEKSKK